MICHLSCEQSNVLPHSGTRCNCVRVNRLLVDDVLMELNRLLVDDVLMELNGFNLIVDDVLVELNGLLVDAIKSLPPIGSTAGAGAGAGAGVGAGVGAGADISTNLVILISNKINYINTINKQPSLLL